MKHYLNSLILGLGVISSAQAVAAVEYVKVCSLYGAGFHYIPGTDICLNDETGDARKQTAGGTWRSLLPYPEGKWVMSPRQECSPGKQVKLGAFKSTDFTQNAWERMQTAPVPLQLQPNQLVTKVIMSGGFYDPRLSRSRHGVNGFDGLCLRSIDPNIQEVFNPAGSPINPPFGNGFLPVGCIANSRIVGMPMAYAITSTSSYPSIDQFFNTADQQVSGPYVYGTHLVLTTDLNNTLLTYHDNTANKDFPLAGTVSVSVCVEPGVESD